MTENYTIAETFTLPSGGKVYEREIDPIIKLRSMTTLEEMKRLSPSQEYPYRNLCEMLDDCIVGEHNFSTYDLCVGDYQFLLFKLRVVTYGSDFRLTSTCPYCHYENDDTINLDSLPTLNYSDELEKYKVVELPISKHQIKLRMITPRIQDMSLARSRELKKKMKNNIADYSEMELLAYAIVEIDGKNTNSADAENFVMNLPMRDTNYLSQVILKATSLIGIDSNLTFICDLCGLDYTSPIKATAEFFRPILDL